MCEYEPFFPPVPCADPQPPYFLTAYEIAVKRGFKGTEEEWLVSLTAFYMAQKAGYTGTIDDWLALIADPVPDLQIGEVVTLDSNKNASATIAGTRLKPLLNLAIPRGYGLDDAVIDVSVATQTAENALNVANTANEAAGKAQTAADKAQSTADKALPKSGGTMTGAINMGSKKVTNLATPTNSNDAANKKYVDDTVGAKHKPFSAVLVVNGWTGTEAPYTQTITIKDEKYPENGILASDNPHITPVYGDDLKTKLAQKEAWNMVSEAKTIDGSITFTCFEEKPETAIPIEIEVNR